MEPTYTIIPADKKKEVEEQLEKAQQILDKITEEVPSETLAKIAKYAHDQYKTVEQIRESVIRPALNAQKDINKIFKPVTRKWDAVKVKAKQTIQAQQLEAERQKQAAIEAEVALAPSLPIPDTSLPEQLSEVEVFPTFTVLDWQDVPDRYKTLDWSALKIAWREGVREFPGLHWEKKTSLRVK